jgi:hypothetical protein
MPLMTSRRGQRTFRRNRISPFREWMRPRVCGEGSSISSCCRGSIPSPSFAFLEGDDDVLREHQAHLLGHGLPGPFVEGEHLEHDVEMVIVVLHLRALAGAGDVLYQQGMQPEVLAEAPDGLDVVDAVHVDPGHRRHVLVREAFLHRRYHSLPTVGLVVVNDGYPHLLGLPLADVHRRAGRQAGLRGALLDEPDHLPSSSWPPVSPRDFAGSLLLPAHYCKTPSCGRPTPLTGQAEPLQWLRNPRWARTCRSQRWVPAACCCG